MGILTHMAASLDTRHEAETGLVKSTPNGQFSGVTLKTVVLFPGEQNSTVARAAATTPTRKKTHLRYNITK